MLMNKINDIGLKAFERGSGDFLNVLRTAVQTAPLLAVRIVNPNLVAITTLSRPVQAPRLAALRW